MKRKLVLISLIFALILGLVFSACAAPAPTPTPSQKPPLTSSPALTQPPASILTPTSTSTTTSTTTSISTPSPSGTPIKIGFISSFTGESAQAAPPQKAALEFRLNQIGNQIGGRPLQLIIADDASSPTSGADVVKKQVMLDAVDVVLGPTNGPAAVAAANFMKTANPPIPIFITMAKPGIVLANAANNNIFLPTGTDKATGYYIGLYAYDQLHYKTATILFEDMVSGQDKLGAFTQAFEKQGGKVVQQQAIKSGTVDFSAQLAALKSADCVAFWYTPGPMSRFVAQYCDSGKSMPMVIPDASVLYVPVMTQIGEKTIGITGEINYCTLVDTQTSQTWVADYQRKVGYLPSPQAAVMDQALLVYLEALKATGLDTSPAKINEAIHKVKLDTPAGSISFTPQGMGIGDMYICQSTKLTDRIDWRPLYKYSQMVLDVPQ